MRVRTNTPPKQTKKNGPQALGLSRCGLSTKIHAMAVSEIQALGVILSGYQEGDAPVGEEMLAEVSARKRVEAVGTDRAYDSDAIRAMIAAAGKAAVIPSLQPGSTHQNTTKSSTSSTTKPDSSFAATKATAP